MNRVKLSHLWILVLLGILVISVFVNFENVNKKLLPGFETQTPRGPVTLQAMEKTLPEAQDSVRLRLFDVRNVPCPEQQEQCDLPTRITVVGVQGSNTQNVPIPQSGYNDLLTWASMLERDEIYVLFCFNRHIPSDGTCSITEREVLMGQLPEDSVVLRFLLRD